MFLSLLHVNVGDDPNRPRPGRLWLRDVYRIHQRLWMAFPTEKRRTEDPYFLGPWDGPPVPEPKPKRCEVGFLFRIERDGRPRILVQSVQRPNWEYAFQNAPYLLHAEQTHQVREFDPSLQCDQAYRFRLLANVVTRKSLADPQGRTRPNRPDLVRKRRPEFSVRPHPLPDTLPTDPSERNRMLFARWDPWREWLHRIGAKRGFRIKDEPGSPLHMEPTSIVVRNPGKNGGLSNRKNPMNRIFNAGLFEGVLVCTDAQQLANAIVSGIGPAKAFGFGLLSLAPVREHGH